MNGMIIVLSLYPAIPKEHEKILANQLTSFRDDNELPSKTQYGFRRKATVTENYKRNFWQTITNWICSRFVIYLELLAVSTIKNLNERTKPNELKNHGIDNHCFRVCLSTRTQSVRICGEKNDHQRNEPLSGYHKAQFWARIFTIFISDLSITIKHCLLVP